MLNARDILVYSQHWASSWSRQARSSPSSEKSIRGREAREEQDYDIEARPLTAQDAEQVIASAERFVARLERYLREAGAIE